MCHISPKMVTFELFLLTLPILTQVLNLSHCFLGNLIPVELGRLTNLQTLDLSGNNLTGTIPAGLFTNCSNLATFNLSSNRLNSSFPPEIANCRDLRILDLGDNTLHGEIPVEIGQLADLEKLVVAECSGLSGSIPDPLISGCKNLTFLDLSWNKLTGEIPLKLGNCTKLVVLNLQGNWLAGSIPDNLGQLKQLRALMVGSNHLTGTLPQSLTQCTSLLLLDVSNNSLAGGIPSWLSQVPTLEFLAIQNNRFSGPIPVEITTLSVLKYMDASNNSLEGSILPALGGMETLRFLRLSNNKFTGSIPKELGSLYGLQCLDLSSNALTGTIPSSLGQLQDLLWLQLGRNDLTGMIPKQLTNCTSLMWINLSENNLNGKIPPDFATLGLTADKVYQKNHQHPWDVAGLGECTILRTWIPDKSQIFDSLFAALERGKCRSWLDTVLRGEFTLPNQLGKQKVLGYWQLNDNYLTGPIPDLSNSTSLGFLALGDNQLSGSFPTNITHLPLYDVNVSHNNLNESIPASLGHSQLLMSLDMSFNNLTGGLPTELGYLHFLIVFNISYNKRLSGKIPTGGQMTTLSWYPYVGDPNLCFVNEGILKYLHPPNDSSLHLPGLCPNSTGTPSAAPGARPAASLMDKMKGPLVTAVTSIVCSFAALLAARTVYWLYKRWRAWHQGKLEFDMLMDDSSRRYSYFRDKGRLTNPVASFGLPALKALTYADLVVATDNFSPDNILGDGGFGIVYRAQLRSGTIVAVKKLIQDGAQGQREFQAEMETLGTIQHGNLVSLLGYCCNNEEKILVYELLKYGSLDDWLHESDIKAAELDWQKRLQIALGTARGLAFLHHDCLHQIIHRDMKSSNILLDENFEAFLTDFGMARIMDVNCTHVSTIVAGTPGYVPPEYSQTWKATTKGDVYSFGVVLLELVSGKRPTGPHFNGLCGSNLVERVRILEREGRHEEACDQIVLQSGNRREIDQFLSLGILCTNVSPTKRPSMKEVTTMLEDILRIQTNSIVA